MSFIVISFSILESQIQPWKSLSIAALDAGMERTFCAIVAKCFRMLLPPQQNIDLPSTRCSLSLSPYLERGGVAIAVISERSPHSRRALMMRDMFYT